MKPRKIRLTSLGPQEQTLICSPVGRFSPFSTVLQGRLFLVLSGQNLSAWM